MSKQKQTFASLDPTTLAWLEELGITSASELPSALLSTSAFAPRLFCLV